MLGDQQVYEVWASMPSKNLLNPAWIEDGKYTDKYGYLRDETDGHYAYVPIQGDEPTIYFNSKLNGGNFKANICLCDANKKYISGTYSADERTTNSGKYNYVYPKNYSNAKYVLVSWTNTLEHQSVTVTQYTDYYNDNLPFGSKPTKMWTWTPKHTEINTLYLDDTTGGIEIPYVPTLNTKIYVNFAQDWSYNDPSYNREEDLALVFHAGPQFAAAYCTYNSYNSYGGRMYYSAGHTSYTANSITGNTISKGKFGSFTLDLPSAKGNCNSSDKAISVGTNQPTQNLVFLGPKPSGASGCVTAKGKFYEAKIYENGELIYDLRAVQRNADGIKCIFDKISRQYFYAQLSNPT